MSETTETVEAPDPSGVGTAGAGSAVGAVVCWLILLGSTLLCWFFASLMVMASDPCQGTDVPGQAALCTKSGMRTFEISLYGLWGLFLVTVLGAGVVSVLRAERGRTVWAVPFIATLIVLSATGALASLVDSMAP